MAEEEGIKKRNRKAIVMDKIKKLIVYKDRNKDPIRKEIIENKLELKKLNIELINIEEKYVLSNDIQYLIYTLGDVTISAENATIVASGPDFSSLGKKENRDQLIKDVTGFKNVFVKYLETKDHTPKNESLSYMGSSIIHSLDLADYPNRPDLVKPKLESNIETAIAAIKFLEVNDLSLYIENLNIYIGSTKKMNVMTYQEAIAILLFLEKFNNNKVYFNDKEIINVDS